MRIKHVLALGSVAVALAACDSGDITLSPTTVDNSTGGGGGSAPTPNNPCATYTEAGQTFSGQVDANGNCVYSATFVSDTKPITVSLLTFPNFGGSAHLRRQPVCRRGCERDRSCFR